MTVTKLSGAKRSSAQNATSHAWYGQIAAWNRDQSITEAKAECKLLYGKPILCRDNSDWMEKWEPLYGPLSYGKQLVLFECIPVTSVMTTKQMNEYMNNVQQVYRSQGVPLIDPEFAHYMGAPEQ